MPRRAYTKELYDKLVAGYRITPNNHSAASRHAGCDRKTAQRAYELGWPKRSWAPPIKDFLAKEKEAIRAERQRAAEAAQKQADELREKAQKDAIDAQKQEAASSAASRANALALANVIGRIVIGCIPLAERVQKSIKEDITITPKQAMQIFSSAAYVVKQGNEAIRLALEIERLRVGEPTNILKLQAEDLSVDDVASQLAHMHRSLKRAVEKGVEYGADVSEELQDAIDFEEELDDDPDPEDGEVVH